MRHRHLLALLFLPAVSAGCIEWLERSQPTVIHEIPSGYAHNWIFLFHECENGSPFAKGAEPKHFVATYPADGMFFHDGPPFERNWIELRLRRTDGNTTPITHFDGTSGTRDNGACTYSFHGFAPNQRTALPRVEDMEDLLSQGCARCRPSTWSH